jgi:ATP-binding cassette subfamily B protein IrtB
MENTNSLGLLLSFARPCRRLLAASVGLAVLGVASGMVPYFAVSYMIVDLYAGTATPESLFLFALIALLGQTGRVALGTGSTVLSHRAAFAILKGIRTDIAAKLSRMPLGSVIETPSGKLKTLIVDTVEKMEVPLAHLIPELTSNLLVPLFMAAYLFWLDWRMALLALATFPVGLFCYMAMTKDYAERYATVQDAGKGMNAAIVEYINGIEVIKAFNQSSASYGKFVAAVRANRDAMKDWFRATNGYYVAGMAIAPASLITVLPAGIYFHMSGTLDAPAAITCFILSLGLIQPILQALGYTDSLAMMDSTLKEVSDLRGRPEMVRPSNCVPLRGHGIEFDQVSFAYTGTGREVLQDVSFKIVEGGMTAIVGPSGSGKSTLAKLLVSFWEAGASCSAGWMSASSRCLRSCSPSPMSRRTISCSTSACGRISASAGRTPRTGKWKRLRRLPRAASSRHCPADMIRLPGMPGRAFPGASASASPLRGPCSRTAPSWCWTRRRPLPIPKTRRSFRSRSAASSRTRRWWSLRTAFPPSSARIALWSWTGAACPPWARTRNCCKPRLCTGDSGNRIPGHGMPKERNMIETIRRLLDFSDRCRTDLLCAFGYGVLYSVSEVIPVLAIVVALEAVLSPSGGGWFAVAASGGLMGLSVAGKIIFGKRATERRMLASYDMCADKRIEVGEILKRVPLGYFSQNRLGELTATLTTTLGEIETNAVAILDKVANGFVHAVAITLLISWYDWHAGLITAAGLVVSLFVYGAMQRKGRKLSPVRQAAQSRLVAAVLEYVQGMAVVKAFGLGDRSNRAVDEAIEACRASNTDLERSFSTLAAVYQLVFKVAAFGVLLSSGLLYLSGDMDLIKCLLLMVSSFMLYAHIEMMGSVSALSRVISVALDRMESLKNAPLLDERGEEFVPESFDIRMEDVVFSYDGTRLLEGINLVIPQGTTTAIVGPSGSGKTTLCSLIARFWDVQEGRVLFGGRDVREYTCDGLLRNISMVFQNVYLFEDTILNNIRFGKPDATMEEVREAARKARCHDFIMALPEGYETPVGEGGVSLSGGERQRISLARAMLKDAPVIILDEATASVDPENERQLQEAFEALTRDKTVIMIAHRLSTVRKADQILVLDKGRIIQRGRHEELMEQGGLYADFIRIREQAVGWSL